MTWHAKETVRRLYDIDDPDVAAAYLDELVGDMAEPAMPPEVRSLAGTLRRWRAQILAWHRAKVSNGPTEAFNLIKRIKRVGFGFRRFRKPPSPRPALRRQTELGPIRHHHTPLKSEEPVNRDQEGKFARKVTAETDPGLGGQTATALDLAPTDLPVSAMADLARALDAKEEEWEELAAASPDDDFLQAKAKFHTEVLDDIRSQIQDHVNLPYEATSDEELFIALTEQADAAYAEEGYDASARYRCYAEVLSESLPQWMETPDREMLAEAGVDPRSLAPGDEPQAVAVLARAGLDADDEASDHWLQSSFEQLQAVLACCSPIASCPPPSRVPSPGYAFPQPLTRVTIVI